MDSTDSSAVHIWDADAGTIRYSLSGHQGGVQAAVISHDGNWFQPATGLV